MVQIHVRAPVSKPLCLRSDRASFVNSYSSVQVRPGAPTFACRLRLGRPVYQGRDVIVSISACDADCAGANPVALTIINPVGRSAQAAVCKTAKTGAIPAPGFQPSLPELRPGGPVLALGATARQASLRRGCGLASHSRDTKSRCRSGLHRPGCGGSTPPSCRDPCGWPCASIAVEPAFRQAS